MDQMTALARRHKRITTRIKNRRERYCISLATAWDDWQNAMATKKGGINPPFLD
jgi:hypothetical protein